ncbi:MAG: hypothetical protein Kow0096_09550 [Thiohalomonadaceae bacterium]
MGGGELLSLLINIGVGAYFAWYYPRSVRGKLERMPMIFTLLNRVLPVLGYLLMVGSVVYALLRVGDVL